MHVPDGFLDGPRPSPRARSRRPPWSLCPARGPARTRRQTAPLAGLVAAFIFAVQMLNFPVGAGTSGHLLGGALAAVLVGPWTAVLCMSVGPARPGLFFADGGLTALGTNITLMGVVTVVVGWALFRAGAPGAAAGAGPR